MGGKRNEAAPGRLFTILFGLLVRARNRAARIGRRVKLALRGYDRPRPEDRAGLETLRSRLPELGRYEEKGALRQLRARALLKGYRDLEAYAADADEAELKELKENLTFTGTHFFRGGVWPALADACREAFSGRDRVRIWCAGCASGKEVYSILMTLREILPPEAAEVLATDHNEEMLARCRRGCYPLRTLDEIPARYRHFVETRRAGPGEETELAYRWQIRFREELRRQIATERMDLLKDPCPGVFDLILCRNVIKFFTPEARLAVQRALAGALEPGGLLVLSEQREEEIPDPAALGLARLAPGLYRKMG